MERLNSIIQRYLVLGLPAVIAVITWSYFQSDIEIRRQGSFALTALWEVLSWGLIVWFGALLVFLVLLVFRKDTQESAIKRLAGISERDEREEIIMGLAARRSFVATTAFLIVLLFISCFTVSIARLPDGTVDGKKGMLTIGFNLTATDKKTQTAPNGSVVFEHHDLPLSKSAILLLVLFWQISTFKYKAQKELSGI